MSEQSARSEQQVNIEVVRRFIAEFWNGGDDGSIDRHIVPEYVDHAYEPNDRRGLAATAAALRSAFPDQSSEELSVTAQDDRVVVQLRMRGTHLGAFRGTAPTGSRVDVRVYREFRLASGLIAEHWALLDTASLLRQIGAELHDHPACRIEQRG